MCNPNTRIQSGLTPPIPIPKNTRIVANVRALNTAETLYPKGHVREFDGCPSTAPLIC